MVYNILLLVVLKKLAIGFKFLGFVQLFVLLDFNKSVLQAFFVVFIGIQIIVEHKIEFVADVGRVAQVLYQLVQVLGLLLL